MSAVELQSPQNPVRRTNLTRLAALQAAIALIAIGLLVPESEMRAKGFKLNLIVKNISRHVL